MRAAEGLKVQPVYIIERLFLKVPIMTIRKSGGSIKRIKEWLVHLPTIKSLHIWGIGAPLSLSSDL
jgi:hypothetical protein